MTIGNLKLYDLFRKDLHLSDDKALEVVNALDDHYEKKSSAKMEQLATKAELVAVKTEISNVRSELKEDIGKVRMELKEDIGKVRTELTEVRQELKDDIGKVRVEVKETENKLVKTTQNATILQYILIVATIASLLKYAGVFK